MSVKKNISSFTVIVIFLCLALAGIALLPLLPVKLSPSHSLPKITISFSMHSSAPRVVEMEATSKLEAMLTRVKGIKNIYSRSGNGWGNITLEFDKHTSIDVARFETSTIIRQAWNELPKSVSYPYLSISRVQPIFIQNYAEDVIKTKLSSVKGIYRIDVTGATPSEWQLEYDSDVLQSVNVSIADIQNAVQLYYKTEFIGMGELRDNGKSTLMRVVLGRDVKNNPFDASLIPVTNSEGRIIYLNELVKVTKTEESPNSYYRINGLNSIYISILAEETANQLKLSEKVMGLIEDIKKELPYGYELHRNYDATEYIKAELDKI